MTNTKITFETINADIERMVLESADYHDFLDRIGNYADSLLDNGSTTLGIYLGDDYSITVYDITDNSEEIIEVAESIFELPNFEME